jgi:tRNA-(ms[2]io[6]A)-hydroxylase
MPSVAVDDATVEPVLDLLRCRTPATWVESAVRDIDTVLLDHASLELKAALAAQKLIRRCGSLAAAGSDFGQAFQGALLGKMSRLAREELRHFEQVHALIERRGGMYRPLPPSRYAASLHEIARDGTTDSFVDALVIGAVIEARSCERFFSLVTLGRDLDASIGRFYASLLRSEARHFADYLGLARAIDGDIGARIEVFLARDAVLVESEDTELRFLSGVPVENRAPGVRVE